MNAVIARFYAVYLAFGLGNNLSKVLKQLYYRLIVCFFEEVTLIPFRRRVSESNMK